MRVELAQARHNALLRRDGHSRASMASPAIICGRGENSRGHRLLFQQQKSPLSTRNKKRNATTTITRAAAADSESSSGSSSSKLVRMPIFPLSMVALPAAHTPLQIFEARYRVLFSTLLAGMDGIEDGLISPDKPWTGTRRFGMAYFDQQANGLAATGCVLEITEHSMMDDGRLFINSVGKERFRIEEVVEERPVLVCDVEILKEDLDESEEARVLAAEVAELFRNVVRLSVKLREAPVPSELENPSQLTVLGPSELSFWVASVFAGNPYNQQALLEEENTMKRLRTEEELLSSTLKYLSAQAALQSAFSSGSGEETS